MPIHDKFYTGSSVSRHLSADERSFLEVVYQSGKPVLDSELNLNQEIRQRVRQLLADRGIPSGFTKGQGRTDPLDDFIFNSPGDPDWLSDSFIMRKQGVLVAGFPLVLEYTNLLTPGFNRIQLDAATTFNGTPPTIKRTDFIFLEVWQALVSDSSNATGTVTVYPLGAPALPGVVDGDILSINGIPLTARAAAPVVDEFLIGADQATTASAIAAAINDPLNSFSGFVSAQASGAVVTIRSVVSGAAGNLITLTVTNPGVAWVRSAPTLLGGVDEPNKPTQDTVYRHGNVGADPTVNLPDDLADPVIGTETAKRVQVQYRIRATGQSEAVSFKAEPNGFSNVSVLAQGATSAPVAGYQFVKADNSSVAGSSDATAYGYIDAGLWIAGDGTSTSATDLGTLDGFVYAIPIGFVFRRNDAYDGGAGAGWDPLNNTNGALPDTHPLFINPAVGNIPVDTSDRPDGAFHNAIRATDFQDLRYHVSEVGVDLVAELQYQIQLLMDNALRTWAVDAADKNTLGGGSGDVSTQFLVCNQIGRDAGHGGTAPISGSTLRGDTIRNYDHCARRFGDQPVNEILVLAIGPTDDVGSQPGKYVTKTLWPANNGWSEGDEINLDLDTLNATTPGDYDHAKATFFGFGPGNASIMDFAPPGTMVMDVRSVRHDDGHSTTAVDQNAEISLITGLGTGHVKITLDANTDTVNGGDAGNPDHRMVGDGVDDGSQRRIFIELEVSYPLGSGTTDTPDVEVVPDPTVWPRGPVLENLVAMRPDDWDDLLAPRFRDGYREMVSEYIATDPNAVSYGSGTPITETVVSRDRQSIRFPRRVFGSSARVVGITDIPNAQPHNIDETTSEYGSSSRLMRIITGGGAPEDQAFPQLGQTLCGVSYFSQDPLPNWGAPGGGYQVGVYFRTTAPQTVGAQGGALVTLPDPLELKPLATLGQVYSGQVGMGSVDLAFPYASPLEQIPVNDDGTATFPAEWYFAATASISVADFNANTGMIGLHSFVQVDGTTLLELASKDKDNEFRAMYKGIAAGYRPTAFGQELSNVTRHKNWTGMLAQATGDSDLFRKDEVLLVVVSRFAELDAQNGVSVTDSNNRTSAAIYRLRNRLAIVGN